MDKESKEDKTKALRELMKVRNTKKIIYKGIYTKYVRQIVD